MDVKDLNSWGLTEVIARVIEDGFYIDEETGEVFFTGDELNKLEEALDNKLNGLCGYIKKTESQVEMLKSRKNDVERNIKFYENRASRLKDFLKILMQANNIEKKELPDFRLGTKKSSSVEIIDESEALQYLDKHPELEACKKVETKISLNKREVKVALENEKAIPGVRIVENKNVTIK